MNRPLLSCRELRILAAIEDELRQDADLDRMLATMRLDRTRRLRQAARAARPLLQPILMALSLVLLSTAVATRSTTLAYVALFAPLGLLFTGLGRGRPAGRRPGRPMQSGG